MNIAFGRAVGGRVSRRTRVFAQAAAVAVAIPLLIASAALTGAQTSTPPASAAACPSGTPGAGSAAAKTPSAAASPEARQCVTIDMEDIYFAPNLVTIPADTPVEIVLQNKGAALHNFSITDHKNPNLKNLNISVNVDPGKTGSVTVNASAGTYYFFCNQPGHEQAGMYGYLVVKKDATISTQSVTVTPRAG
ncbi:MAG TPA: cupredoxin domain-containing protein [Thermomicrobiales bacterium]|nr:cupredoxin domain-containing protein [Thermomicrobiales bacterium]